MKTVLALCSVLVAVSVRADVPAPPTPVTFKASVSSITDSGALVYKLDNGLKNSEPYFIYGNWPGLVDGDVYTFTVYPAATMKYKTVLGATKTVRAFSTSEAVGAVVARKLEDGWLVLFFLIALVIAGAILLHGKSKKQETKRREEIKLAYGQAKEQQEAADRARAQEQERVALADRQRFTVAHNGQELGELTVPEIRDLYTAGQVTLQDHYYDPKAATWQQLTALL